MIVELKAVTEVAKIHECQVLTQLKLTGLPVGLLINFNVPVLADGVQGLSIRSCPCRRLRCDRRR